MEFLEDGACLGGRYAEAGVINADPQPCALAPAADQNAAVKGIFDRVGNEILQQASQQAPIRPHRHRALQEHELQTLFARQRSEFDLDPPQQILDVKVRELRLHDACIEPRDVEQSPENLLHGLERGVDVADQV